MEDFRIELKLNVDITKLRKALAYHYAISSPKNVIALAGFRPSMLVAYVVLVSVNILVKEQYFFCKS